MHKDILERSLGLTRNLRALAVLVCVAALALPAFGAPYTGQPFTYQQPDGSEITVYVYGDEFYAIAETLDGYTVTKDLKTGQFCYAKVSPNGKGFISTGKPIGKGKPPPGLKKKVRLAPATRAELSKRRRDLLGYDSKGRLKAELAAKLRPRDFGYKKYSPAVEKEIKRNGYKPRNPNAPSKGGTSETESIEDISALLKAASDMESSTDSTTPPQPAPPSSPTIDTRIGLVLLASFPDRQSDIVFSQAQVDNYFNDPGYTEFGNATSVYGYFSVQSNGKLSYNCIVTAYFIADNPRSYYVTDQGVAFGVQARWLINEGIDKLAAEGFDFAQCDGNGDGVIDGVNCFYAGVCVNAWADDFGLWPHKSGSSNGNLSTGALTSNNYQYQITDMTLTDLRIGTVCHENGHMLCNFPDLYSYNGNAADLKYFSLMHSGNYAGNEFHPSNVDPYLKDAAGWATVIDVDSSSSLRASMKVDNNTFYRFKNPSNSQEYFIMELRDNTGYEGPYGGHASAVNPTTGLVVYHANEAGLNTYSTIMTADNPNADYTKPYELLILEDERAAITPWYDDPTPSSGDAFEAGDVIDDTTTASAKFWSSSGRTVASGMWIHDISTPTDRITFVIGPTPTGSPTISTTATAFDPVCDYGGNANSQSFSLGNSGGGTLNYTISDNQNWLSLNPTAGSVTTGADTLTITYNTSGLASGSYSAAITITDTNADNSPYTIPVNLTVKDQPVISLSTASIVANGLAGTSGPEKEFTISNTGGGLMNYSLSKTQSWLTFSQTTGMVQAEVDTIYVNFDATSLAAGTYYDTITIASSAASNSPQTIPVEFVVGGTDMIVTYPNGGEDIVGLSTETITWSSSLGGNVKIDLYKSGVLDQAIVASTPNAGTYDWDVPLAATGTTWRIKITSIEQPSKIDDSNGDFSISPITYSFETGFDGWLQDASDDIDWTRQSGPVPSRTSGPTGPAGASDGLFYLFTESSSPNYNVTANVYKDFDFSAINQPLFSFDYHMYGAAMGALYLEASTNGGSSWATAWSLTGDQGDAWVIADADLSAYGNVASVRLRFRGVTGSSFTSDMAVDNISISEGQVNGFKFATDSFSVQEDVVGGVATITVERVGDTTGEITVDYATSNGTATAGADYTATSGTLTWGDGVGGSKTFTVSINNDSTNDADQETVALTLSNPTAGTGVMGINPATLSIIDDEIVVAFDGNSATSGTPPADQYKTLGVDLTLSGNTGNLAQTGNNFSGWNTQTDGNGTDYPAGGTYTNDADITLYTKWLPNTLTVSIAPSAISENGGTATATVTRNSATNVALAVTLAASDTGEATVASGNIPIGQTAADFAITAVDDTLKDGTQTVTITASAAAHLSGDDTLDITDDEFVVTYDGNGSLAGSPPADTNTYISGSTVTVLGQATLTKEPYLFGGWNTASDGSGTAYIEDNTFTINADATLYAVWNSGPLTIYEPFAQTAGDLAGQAGGTGLSGNWSVNQTVNVVSPSSLSYGNLPNAGGQVELPNNSGVDAWVTTNPDLANNQLLDDGATLWFSFVYQKTTGSSANEHSGFAFGTAPVDATFSGVNMSGYGVGFYTQGSSIYAATWNNSGANKGGSFSIAYSVPVFIVGKVEWGATTGAVETITLYTPSLTDLSNLGTGVSKTIAGFDQAALNTISMTQRNSGGTQTYDEIRFGSSYESVIGQGATTLSVTYDGNGSDGGAVPVDSNSYVASDTVTVLGNTGNLFKAGHTFDGWNTQSDGNGTNYVADDSFSITSSTTLYSQWATVGFSLSKATATVAENGGTNSFTVVLDNQPTNDVVFDVISSDTGEAGVDKAQLTFTSGNWDTPQEVTITGINDDTLGDDAATITVSVSDAASDDAFDSLADKTVSVTCTNDDTAGFTLSKTSTTVAESGGTNSFTVVLDAEPASNVVITISSSDTGEAGVDKAQLTFTSGNWDTPQEVTITGVNDAALGDDAATITMSVNDGASDDSFDPLADQTVSVTCTDDDTAGFTVTESAGSTTVSEAGTSDTFTVRLDAEPASNVVLTVTSDDTGEATVDKSSLTFTSADWNTAQTVTVTGVDDAIIDGTQIATITVAINAANSDDAFDLLSAQTVAASVTDNDAPGVTVSSISNATAEDGTTATFTVVLNSQPTNDVSIGLSSSDTGEGTVSPTNLTFNSGNWNSTQTVTVTGVDDDVDDGDQVYTIVTAAASSLDTDYDGIDPDDVSVTNGDNDTTGITVGSISGDTDENNNTATFTVVLDTQPSTNVTIGISSNDEGEGTVSPTNLTFNSGNWNSAQTVTVTGQDDSVDDGDQAYTIVTATATSSDSLYNGINPVDVDVTNLDDDFTLTVTTGTGGASTTGGGVKDEDVGSYAISATPSASYDFVNWTVEAGTASFDNAASTSTIVTVSSNATVQANFAIKTYTVSYDANGADSGTAPSSQIKTNGVDLVLASNSGGLTKTDYLFSGWNTATNGTGTGYATGSVYSVDADLNLFAKWAMAPPSAPTGLSATPSVGQVDLSWTASSNATSYKVKRAMVSNGTYTEVGTTNATAFSDTTVTNGTIYYYVVSALNSGGESSDSDEVEAVLIHVLPFMENFESRALGDLADQYLWAASNAVVQTNMAYDGVQAGSITSETGYVEQTFAGSETNVWTDFQIQPVFFEGDFDPSGIDGTSIMYFNTNRNPVVYNGSNAVVLSDVQVATGEWVRVTVHSDYTTKKWDLYINNALATNDLGFYKATVDRYESFNVSGGAGSGAMLDDVSIDMDSPLAGLMIPAPSGLAVVGLTSSYAELIWTDNSTNATGFSIERSGTSGSGFAMIGSTATTNYVDNSVSPGQTYYYQVIATNNTLNSVPSTEVSATTPKAMASVTFTNLMQVYDGNARVAGYETSPTGLSVVVAYDGGAAVPTNAGNYAVTGTVNDISYQGAATGTLVVAAAALEVTADDKSKTVGDGEPVLTHQITSGQLYGSDAITGSLTRVVGESSGLYAINQGTLTAGSNYALSFVSGTLTILTATGIVDGDGDSMDDGWEANHTVDDPTGDADGDGVTNFEEFMAGTSPTNVLQFLQILSITINGSGQPVVVWASEQDGTAPPRQYRVQRRANLQTGSWTGVASNITAAGVTTGHTDTNTPAASTFYRIEPYNP